MSTRDLTFYIAKCVTGGVLVFSLGHLFNYTDIMWCLISILLVLSPDSNEAIPLALTRIKANLAAAVASVLCLLTGLPVPVAVCLAFAVAIVFCHWIRTMTGSRSGLAAVVIIMLHGGGVHPWWTALERLLSVIAGCLLGLVITFAFHRQALEKSGKGEAGGE